MSYLLMIIAYSVKIYPVVLGDIQLVVVVKEAHPHGRVIRADIIEISAIVAALDNAIVFHSSGSVTSSAA
jgi:hypothetical protein